MNSKGHRLHIVFRDSGPVLVNSVVHVRLWLGHKSCAMVLISSYSELQK